MSLYNYIVRLETILQSRQDIIVELLQVDVLTVGVKFSSNVRFYDGSQLSIVEHLESVGNQKHKRVAYKYHYQNDTGELIFRYDNAPHHQHLTTFPDHKHVGKEVIESIAPELNAVLTEIDHLIYPETTDK